MAEETIVVEEKTSTKEAIKNAWKKVRESDVAKFLAGVGTGIVASKAAKYVYEYICEQFSLSDTPDEEPALTEGETEATEDMPF